MKAVVALFLCLIGSVFTQTYYLQNNTKQFITYQTTRPQINLFVKDSSQNNSLFNVGQISIPTLQEVHYPISLPEKSTLIDQFNYFNSQNYITVATFNLITQSWSLSKGKSNGTYSSFTIQSRMSNNATISVQASVNSASDTSYPIPRPASNSDCSQSYLATPPDCSCSSSHITPKNAVKISVNISNYNFQGDEVDHSSTSSSDDSSSDNSNHVPAPVRARYLRVDFQFTAEIDMDQLSNQLSSVIQFAQCDVADVKIPLRNNRSISLPMSFYTTCTTDGNKIQTIYVNINPLQIVSQGDGIYDISIQVYFPYFEHSLSYDPDFSIFLKGDAAGNGGNVDSQGVVQGGTGSGAGGDGGPDKRMVAGLVVGLVGFAICVSLVVVVIGLLVFWKVRSVDLGSFGHGED